MCYQMDAQGQVVPVELPAAEGLDASMDFADGMFAAAGSASRADD